MEDETIFDTEVVNDMPEQEQTQVDFRKVSFGDGTFSNPFFWIMVGVVGTVTIQYLMTPKRK